MHAQESGNLGRPFVLIDELAGVRDLLGRKGRGATEAHPLRPVSYTHLTLPTSDLV